MNLHRTFWARRGTREDDEGQGGSKHIVYVCGNVTMKLIILYKKRERKGQGKKSSWPNFNGTHFECICNVVTTHRESETGECSFIAHKHILKAITKGTSEDFFSIASLE
jgi:hypothetical protein